jgi:hypothetical protein
MGEGGFVHLKRLLGLAILIAATAVLITSAGAGAKVPKFDLSTHSGAVKYLKSIGVDPTGVVIQRGLRNYAGPNCPGHRWTCTRSKRVFQIAAAGVNKWQCSATGGSPPPIIGGSSADPLDCSITQANTTGNNVATCIEDESTVPSSTETCEILQTNVSGSNTATVTQKVTQNTGTDQSASQTSSIDQQNGSGANTAQVTQNINQSANSPGSTSQTAEQSSCVDQHGVEASSDPCVDFDDSLLSSGADKSNVAQSVTQNGGGAVGGSDQTQDDSISGHVTQQTTGLATNQNSQDEHQNLGGNGNQTQFGPLTCCTDQGENPGDKYNINQSAHQNASNPTADQNELLIAECVTFGVCKATQSATEDGSTGKNTCTGMACSIGVICEEGSCEPCTPGGEGGCFTECFPYGCEESFRLEARPLALAAQRLLMRLH